jgi:multiple sugar transport system permease protein
MSQRKATASDHRRSNPPRRRSFLSHPRFWFLLPAVIWALIFTIYPVIYALLLSFQRVRLGRDQVFVGLTNFARTISYFQFWAALNFTLTFVVITVAVQVLLGLGLALLVNREMRARSFIRALLILPLFATPVGIGYLGIAMFQETQGPINSFLMMLAGGFGLPPESLDIPWRSHPMWARLPVGIMDTWQWTPFCFLILLAGLQSVPEELYEAVRLDTSNGWHIFRHITLPLLKPVLGITVLLRVIEAFKVIDIPFAFTKGGPGIATQTYTMYVWRTAFTSFDLGYASALGMVFLVLVLVVVNIILWAGRLRASLFSE